MILRSPQTFEFAGLSIVAVAFLVFLTSPGFSENTGVRPERVVDRFSEPADADGIPPGWEALTFKKVPKHTRYTLEPGVEPDSEGFHIKAESENAASGLLRRLEIDPKSFPVLTWRWKIDEIIPDGDVRSKKGDDYAARIYVTFKYNPKDAPLWERIKYGTYKTLYGEYPPKASLNYFWANQLPKGQSVWSPFSKKSRMIAVESGSDRVGEWIREEVNVLKDYHQYFGEDAPAIQGIAVMTDSDNTHSSATAYYDDIVFRGLVGTQLKK